MCRPDGEVDIAAIRGIVRKKNLKEADWQTKTKKKSHSGDLKARNNSQPHRVNYYAAIKPGEKYSIKEEREAMEVDRMETGTTILDPGNKLAER